MTKKIKVLVIVFSALFLGVTLNATPPVSSKGASLPAQSSTLINPGGRFSSPTNAKGQAMNKAELKRELKKLNKESVNQRQPMGGGKSRIVAALLAFFLGGLGIHRFYMGQKAQGFAQLAGTLGGAGLVVAGAASTVTGGSVSALVIIGFVLMFGVAIWAFVDFIRILTGGLQPEEGFND